MLYLVQHGAAKSEEEAPERPLTEEGSAAVEAVAAWAAGAGVGVGEIHHSGKLRAEETAAILARHLRPEAVLTVPGLGPRDDVQLAAQRLTGRIEGVMLVGHLPFLSRLASFLIIGHPEETVVHFRPGGIVSLRRESGIWAVCWALTPELVGGR